MFTSLNLIGDFSMMIDMPCFKLMIFVSIDSKWKSSLPETLISIFVLSEITIGLAFKLWGEIGVRISELLFGETIGPPQLNEYPVEPVGVDTIKPSDQ